MTNYTLLTISGSLRKGSYNTLLAAEAARIFAPASQESADLNLPLLNTDLEKDGLPEPVLRLCAQIRAADAVIITTPEYNKNLSGVLKNALDWISRDKPQPLLGKPVAIMSAAAGRAGGERAQFSLRHALTPFNPRLLYGPEVMIAQTSGQFDEDGRLTNERSTAGLQNLMDALRAEIALSKAN